MRSRTVLPQHIEKSFFRLNHKCKIFPFSFVSQVALIDFFYQQLSKILSILKLSLLHHCSFFFLTPSEGKVNLIKTILFYIKAVLSIKFLIIDSNFFFTCPFRS